MRGRGSASYLTLCFPAAFVSGSRDAIILTSGWLEPLLSATFCPRPFASTLTGFWEKPYDLPEPSQEGPAHPQQPWRPPSPSHVPGGHCARTRKRRRGRVPGRRRSPPQPRGPAPSQPPGEAVWVRGRPRAAFFRPVGPPDEGGAGCWERLGSPPAPPPAPPGQFLGLLPGSACQGAALRRHWPRTGDSPGPAAPTAAQPPPHALSAVGHAPWGRGEGEGAGRGGRGAGTRLVLRRALSVGLAQELRTPAVSAATGTASAAASAPRCLSRPLPWIQTCRKSGPAPASTRSCSRMSWTAAPRTLGAAERSVRAAGQASSPPFPSRAGGSPREASGVWGRRRA